MCGIFGLLTPGVPVNLQACRRATETLAHRGPDGAGMVFGRLGDPSSVRRSGGFDDWRTDSDHVQADWILGHRRLAILDLSANASQPMRNEDGSCWVVFNGEIYNHRQLRRELTSRGHQFVTDHSDTEALLHGYEEWGEDVVDHLRGMFAFGVVDLEARSVFLARDCFGEKPLYFATDSRGVAFGSEPRALIASGFSSIDINTAGVSDYLTFGYVPAPRTIFARINKLGAAEKTTVRLDKPDRTTVRRYWDLTYEPREVPNPAAWHEEFDALLTDAVRARLESDVPLGAFLSGGLDSTSVVQKIALAGIRPRTFTIAFAEERFDESPFAQTVASRFGTLHHVKRLEPQGLLDALQAIPLIFDEPFADASAIPMLALARTAREHVSVALSGDGGDELLGGYTRYHLNTTLERFFDGAFGGMATACGTVLKRAWPDHARGRGLVRLLTPGGDARYRRLVSDTWLAKQAVVGHSDFGAFASAWDEGTPGLANRMCKADLRLYLPEDLMTKVDRTCMAVGLEARAPLLDKGLFEFVAKAPDAMKGHGSTAKEPLRRLVGQSLGHRFAARNKQGFAVPLGRWFRHELRDLIGDTLAGPGTFVQQLFPPKFGANLVDAHMNRTRDMSPRLWTLLLIELWHDRFRGVVPKAMAVA